MAKRLRRPRYRKRISLSFGEQLPPTRAAFTLNVSAQGLAVASNLGVRSGTLLHLALRPGDAAVSARGRVSWTRPGAPQLGLPHTFGVVLESADEAWYGFIAEVARTTAPLAATAAAAVTVEPEASPAAAPADPGIAVHVPVRLGLQTDRNLDQQGLVKRVGADALEVITACVPAKGAAMFFEIAGPDAPRVAGVARVEEAAAPQRPGGPGRLQLQVLQTDGAFAAWLEKLRASA